MRWVCGWPWVFRERSDYGWIVSEDFHFFKGVGLEHDLKDGRGLGGG